MAKKKTIPQYTSVETDSGRRWKAGQPVRDNLRGTLREAISGETPSAGNPLSPPASDRCGVLREMAGDAVSKSFGSHFERIRLQHEELRHQADG